MKSNIKTILWSIGMAFKINGTLLIVWMLFSVALSVLPALAIGFHREIIYQLSNFIASGQGSFADVLHPILMLALLMAATSLSIRYSGNYAVNIMVDTFGVGMEEHLLNCMDTLSMKEYLKKDILDDSDVVLKGGSALTHFVVQSTSILARTVGIISLLIVSLGLHPLIFGFSTIYIVISLFVNFIFLRQRRFVWDSIIKTQRLAGYFENIPNVPGAAKELRIYDTRNEILSNWENSIKPVYDEEHSRAFFTHLSTFITGLGFYIFLLIILVFSLYGVANATMTVDTFLVIFTLFLNIFSAISALTNSMLLVYNSLYRLGRQRVFTDKTLGGKPRQEPSSATNCEDVDLTTPFIFETKNLCFSYNDTSPVLKNINFRLKKGEIVALVGHNGSGKTTLVKLLQNLYTPNSGTIYFMGKPFEHYSHETVRNEINAFFQEFTIFHTSVKENIGVGDIDHVSDIEKVLSAIDKGGANVVVAKLPKGVDTLLQRAADPTGIELSGGERQRIGVARAHMSDKNIIIFDEPAAMLDPIAEMEQFFNIKNKLEGRSAILISHRVGFARMADRIVVLDNGSIVEDDTHNNLLLHNGIYAKFFTQQAKWYDSGEGKNHPVKGE